jgi:hypothetical protein
VGDALSGSAATIDAGSGFSGSLGGSNDILNLADNSGSSVTVSGTNQTINGDSATINTGSSFSGNVTGSNDTVNLGGGCRSSVTLSGTDETINGASCMSGIILGGAGTSATVNGSFAAITASGTDCGVNASYCSITVAAGADVSLTGSHDNIIADAGSFVDLNGNDLSITASDATLDLEANSCADVTGSFRAEDPNDGGNPSYFDSGSTGPIFGGSGTWGVAPGGSQYGDDPIILNLEGGRVETQGLSSSTAHFDMRDNGCEVKTGWGTAGEGYLVYDPENTGTVADASDLVAGFGALDSLAQAVDGETGGTLNSSDPLWDKLEVWIDAAGTGSFQSGQLYSLDQLGIASINLDAAPENEDSNGNTILADSSFTWADGAKGDIAGVSLAFDPKEVQGQTSSPNSVANNSLDSLISSMASFGAPASAQTTTTAAGSQAYQSPLLSAAH